MHIFLTGVSGCGKSTVIDKVCSACSLPVGGFRSGFGSDRERTVRALYLWKAGECPQLDEAHTVVRFDNRGAAPLPHRFDALGTAALDCPGAGLILMDECGRLERDALLFQAAVLSTLDGDTPVLGVVRHGLPGWTQAIAAHPKVAVIEVSEENRDALPEQLVKRLFALF